MPESKLRICSQLRAYTSAGGARDFQSRAPTCMAISMKSHFGLLTFIYSLIQKNKGNPQVALIFALTLLVIQTEP